MANSIEEPTILSAEDLLGAVSNEVGVAPSDWDSYDVRLQWLAPILGASPASPKAMAAWVKIAARHDRDGIEILDINEDKGTVDKVAVEDGVKVELSEDKQGHTVFWRDGENRPCIMGYQFRGFLINAATVLKEDFKFPGRMANKFAEPIRLVRNNTQVLPFSTPIADKIDGIFGRPVRGMTMQGPRISINVSEVVLRPKPSTFRLNVRRASGIGLDDIIHLLEYGQVEGISQWRSGGWGRFKATVKAV